MITFMDEHQGKVNDPEELEEELDVRDNPVVSSNWRQVPKLFGHIYLGAPQKPSEIDVFKNSHPQFKHKKLLEIFKAELPPLNIPVPHNLNEQITTQTKVLLIISAQLWSLTIIFKKIMEFHFIKAQYESKVTWKTDTDYIRCSPMYHNHPRYDCVLLNTINGPVFAQLVLVFMITVDGKDYPIALVQAYEQPRSVSASLRKKDKDLGFLCLQQRKENQMEFVWAQSIIRGAVIVPAYDDKNHSIVFDILDADMTLRAMDLLGQSR